MNKRLVRVALTVRTNKDLALISNTTDAITLIDIQNALATAAAAATDTFSDAFVTAVTNVEVWPIGEPD